MRVRANGHHHAKVLCPAEVPPIEIETLWVGVELHGHAGCARLLEYGREIERVWLAAEQEPAGGVREDCEPWVVEGAQDALGHLRAVHRESRMDRPNDEIEFVQQLVAIVDLS